MAPKNKNLFFRYDPLITDASYIRECISEGYDVNSRDDYGDTVLFWAAQDGKLDVVKELFKSKDLDVNLCGSEGYTPLHGACLSGSIEIMELLLHKGAKVDAVDIDGYIPLYYALLCGSKELVSMLINFTFRNEYDYTPFP